MLVSRPLYLDQIKPYIDSPLVKILVGIRRAGKSCLLKQVKELLLERKVPESQIIHINFEGLDYANIRDKDAFITLVRSLMTKKSKYYLLFDEIQLIAGWDEVINGLVAEGNSDIYLTGSNSELLSSEISTYLTGRYINIPVYPLNFSEMLGFKKARGLTLEATKNEFSTYLERGGFPLLYISDYDLDDGDKIVSDIYTSIIYRDLIERKNIRNTELLSRIIKYVFDNIGNTFSASSITKYLKNELRSLDPETVYNYLDWLEEVFVIKKVSRYDLRGKALLKTQEKYYLGDIGLLYALNGRQDSRLPGILENIVYLDLLSKGYEVHIGKNSDREIDFVAERKNTKLYLQVAFSLTDEATFEREYSAFNGLDDNYPKYILTLDSRFGDSKDGILIKSLPDFLLELS